MLFESNNNKDIQDSLWKSWVASQLSLYKDTSSTRVHNHCILTNRSRGNLSRFQLSRISFRNLAAKGLLPGIQKASW